MHCFFVKANLDEGDNQYQEEAAYVGVHPDLFSEWVDAGAVPSTTIGDVDRADLETLREQLRGIEK